jgi:hypothetical protein
VLWHYLSGDDLEATLDGDLIQVFIETNRYVLTE